MTQSTIYTVDFPCWGERSRAGDAVDSEAKINLVVFIDAQTGQ